MTKPDMCVAANAVASVERGALRASSATVLSRRAFIGAAAIATVGAAHAENNLCADRRWTVVRDLVASGAIGCVRHASAIVPMDRIDAALSAHFGAEMPKPIADCLECMIDALALPHPRALQSANYATAYSISCSFDGNRRIALAAAPPAAPFTATVRGESGSLYVSNRAVSAESNGRWREVSY